jgi:hypothetical protein
MLIFEIVSNPFTTELTAFVPVLMDNKLKAAIQAERLKSCNV